MTVKRKSVTALVLYTLLLSTLIVWEGEKASALEKDALFVYKQSSLSLHNANREIWKRTYDKEPTWWEQAGDRTDPTKLHLGDNFYFNRTPLVLVHGMEDTPESWDKGIEYLAHNHDISNRYFFITYKYNSRLHVPLNGRALQKRLAEWQKASGGHPGYSSPVIIAHSMGGVVSRAYIDESWDPNNPDTLCVKKLITLATPHLGSTAADLAWDVYVSKSTPFKNAMGSFPASLADSWLEAVSKLSLKQWVEYGGDGVGDICYMSPYIKHLLNSKADKIHRERYMYGGAYIHYTRDPISLLSRHNPTALIGMLPVMSYLAKKHSVFDHINDGLVPFHSQLFFQNPSALDFHMQKEYGTLPGNCFYTRADHMGILEPSGDVCHLWEWISNSVCQDVPKTTIQHPGLKLDTANKAWMADLRETIGSWPLNQIVIPGSHDSGTKDITPFSELAMDGNIPWDIVDSQLRNFANINLNQLLKQRAISGKALDSTEKALKEAQQMLDAAEAALDKLGGASAVSQKITIPGPLQDALNNFKNAVNQIKDIMQQQGKITIELLQQHWNTIKDKLIDLGVDNLKQIIKTLRLQIRILQEQIPRIRAILAFAESWLEFIPKTLMARWSITTDKSIAEQLQQGIRYFDLRIEKTAPGDQVWNTVKLVHALRSTRMGLAIRDIKNFVRNQETNDEIVLLDFNHTYNFDGRSNKTFLTWLMSECKDSRGRSLLIPRQKPLNRDYSALSLYIERELKSKFEQNFPATMKKELPEKLIAGVKFAEGAQGEEARRNAVRTIEECHNYSCACIRKEYDNATQSIHHINSLLGKKMALGEMDDSAKQLERHLRSIGRIIKSMGTCQVKTGRQNMVTVSYQVDSARLKKSAGGVYWRGLKMREALSSSSAKAAKDFDMHAKNSERELNRWMPGKIPEISKQIAEQAVKNIASENNRSKDFAAAVLHAHEEYSKEARRYREQALMVIRDIIEKRRRGAPLSKMKEDNQSFLTPCYKLDRIAKTMGSCSIPSGGEIEQEVVYNVDCKRLETLTGNNIWRTLKMLGYLKASRTSLVLNDLWKQPGRMLVFYKNLNDPELDGWDGKDYFWPCGESEGAINSTVENMYLDTLHLQALIRGLQHQLIRRNVAGEVAAHRFHLSQAILSSGNIPALAGWFSYGHSLRTMAWDAGDMSANPALIKLFLGQNGTYAYSDNNNLGQAISEPLPHITEFQDKANIIYLNWPDKSFIDTTVTMNRLRFGFAGKVMQKTNVLTALLLKTRESARALGRCRVLRHSHANTESTFNYTVKRGEKGLNACQGALEEADKYCREMTDLLKGSNAHTPGVDMMARSDKIQKLLATSRQSIPWEIGAQDTLTAQGCPEFLVYAVTKRIAEKHKEQCNALEITLKKAEAIITGIRSDFDKWMERKGLEL